MVLMLKQCCCGCTLKTGTLIIAVVFAILAALQLLIFSVAAVEISEGYQQLRWMQEIEEERERLSATPTPSDGESRNHTTPSGEFPNSLSTKMQLILVWKYVTILYCIVELFDIPCNILLMFAANKDSARLVLIWVVAFSILSSCHLLLFLVLISSSLYLGISIGAIIQLTIIGLLSAGAGYSGLVVWSYYRQLVGMGVARRISQQED